MKSGRRQSIASSQPLSKGVALGGILALLVLVVFLPLACTDRTTPPPESVEKVDPPTLTIGLIPEQNIFSQIDRYKPLAAYLSEKTGIGIKLKVLSRYGDIIDNFSALGLDGAFFGSFTYALAHSTLGVEAIARPESPEGVSTYFGMIFVRKDSGISSAAGMKGKRFAFVDEATTAGYLLPLAYFKENGIGDYRKYFSETYFTGTHEDALLDVLNNRADVGAAKNTVFYRLSESDSRILNELKVIARSPDVPENALALRADIDESIRSGIENTLLGMEADPKGAQVLKAFGASRFIRTTNEDYKPVFEYADSVGMDLTTYRGINDK